MPNYLKLGFFMLFFYKGLTFGLICGIDKIKKLDFYRSSSSSNAQQRDIPTGAPIAKPITLPAIMAL